MKIKKPTAHKTKNIAQQAADSLPKKRAVLFLFAVYSEKPLLFKLSACRKAGFS